MVVSPGWAGIERARQRLASEQGAIRHDWGGRLPIALVYPNSYYLGMSNLGFQTVYAQLNAIPDVVCERAFWEGDVGRAGEGGRDDWGVDEVGHGRGRSRVAPTVPLLLESQRELWEAPVLAFSLSYELDYFNVVAALRGAGVPLRAADRADGDPLVIGGGPCATANPEPLAPFFDALVIGEAEPVLPGLVAALREGIGGERSALLQALAALPGVYVPTLQGPGTADPAARVTRQWLRDLDTAATTSAVLTDDTELGDMYLIEVARGCGRGCRFCLAGHIFRPLRTRSLSGLIAQAEAGLQHRRRLGLVGAAVSDYPEIDELVTALRARGAQVALSSLRMERLSDTLLAALVDSGTRTVTLAPEAGTDRLRRTVAKGLTEDTIFRAVDRVAAHGVRRLKLYFMLGLPGETDEDVAGIVTLVRSAKARLEAHGGTAQVVANVGPYVPKAATPFQWAGMAEQSLLEARLEIVKRGLKGRGIEVRGDSSEWAVVQGALARGDRRLADVLERMAKPSLAAWRRALKECGLDTAALVGPRDLDRPLPWSSIDSGVSPGFLRRAHERALRGAPAAPCGPGQDCHACGVC